MCLCSTHILLPVAVVFSIEILVFIIMNASVLKSATNAVLFFLLEKITRRRYNRCEPQLVRLKFKQGSLLVRVACCGSTLTAAHEDLYLRR